MLNTLYVQLHAAQKKFTSSKVWNIPKLEEFHVQEPWAGTHAVHYSNIHPLEFDTLIQYIAQSDNKLVVEQFKKLLTTAKLTMGDRLERVHKTIRETEERNTRMLEVYNSRLEVYKNASIVQVECFEKFTEYWTKLVASIQLGVVQPGIEQKDYENLLEYKLERNLTNSQLAMYGTKDIAQFLSWSSDKAKKKPTPPPMQKVEPVNWWTGASKRIFERHRKAGKTD